jgi:tripartite-type tricarboxylate transporter receptor subunit TctC
MRIAFWIALVSTTLLAPVQAVFGQSFPAKMVRVVIPFPVGGSSEANFRIISPHLSERWKQQILLEPRPGAAATIGADYVAKSAPDGYTLLLTSTQYVQGPALFAKLPYDSLVDLMPVTIVSISPQAIVAHPSLPAKNIRELIALARTRAADLNMGNAGNMLPTHFFTMLAKVKIEPVPYKGAGPLMTDLMGGHIPLAIAAISSVQGAVRSGRARILGVSSHSGTFPDAPIIAKDLPGFDADAWFGLFVPHGTPREIVGRIHDDVAAVLRMQDVKQRLLQIGGNPGGQTPEEFTTRVRNEIAKWKKVAVAAGMKPQ